MSILAELKRRNVLRAAAAYLAVAWLVVQVAETVFPALGLDVGALRVLLVVLAIGFVPAIVVAWAFGLTPEGLRRERDIEPGGTFALRTNRLIDRGILVLLALGITYFAVDKFLLAPARESERIEQALELGRAEAFVQAHAETSIVVLPFANLSSDPEQAYFADGMAEEMLNLLARIPGLRVISRTSAFSFKGKDLAVAEIAGQLKVSHVLEGSVRRSGDRLRVTAQLIDARTDAHLWSETFDRRLDDVFAIQDEIAGRVVEALEIELLGERPRVRRTDLQAYTLVMQARQMLDSGDEDYARVDAMLQRALEIDPAMAEAWTALAWLYYRCARHPDSDAFCRTLSPEEMMARNIRAIDHALAIDPDNATAIAYDAFRRMARDRDLPGAAAGFERALQLGPTLSDVLRPSMILANCLRRPDVSIRLGEYALRRDPLCSLCAYQLGVAYAQAGRLADAEAIYRDFGAARRGGAFSLGVVLLLGGRHSEALETFATLADYGRALQLTGEAMALHSLGRLEESRRALAELEAGFAGTEARRIAEVHAWTGDHDAAARWLRRALESVDDGDSADAYQMIASPFLGATLEHPELEPHLRHLGAKKEQLAAVRFDPRLPGT